MWHWLGNAFASIAAVFVAGWLLFFAVALFGTVAEKLKRKR